MYLQKHIQKGNTGTYSNTKSNTGRNSIQKITKVDPDTSITQVDTQMQI